MKIGKSGGWTLALALAGIGAVIAGIVAFQPTSTTATSEAPEVVPLELVLLVDTSGSVDSSEYRMQQSGYAEAFTLESITSQIEQIGGIAVIYIEWDAADNQTISIPWTLLKTRADCHAFASKIRAIKRATSGTTMIAPALDVARTQILTNDYAGMRRVIDVSGDGLCKNWNFYKNGVEDGDSVDALDHYGLEWDEVIASLKGVVDNVNGVFIGSKGEHLDFYNDILPQGPNAFTFHAESFAQFPQTICAKILREVSETIPGAYD